MGGPRLLLFLGVLLALGILMSLYYVDEREHAIKFRFGEIVNADIPSGLHFKIPIVNNVLFFPKRVLTINNPQELFLTFEKKNLFVDFFVKWQIVDVAEFFAKRTVPEVVTAERRELMDQMLARARNDAVRLGLNVVDVRVKRIEFSEEVSESVFNRMQQERARVASELRAEGAENAEQIRADADRQRTVILAEAYREAEKTRGDGDASAADVYARAYNKNREFYSFYRSIQAYRRSLGRQNDILVLDAESDFFRYLNESGPQ
jgi:membrane protease subunit HflC